MMLIPSSMVLTTFLEGDNQLPTGFLIVFLQYVFTLLFHPPEIWLLYHLDGLLWSHVYVLFLGSSLRNQVDKCLNFSPVFCHHLFQKAALVLVPLVSLSLICFTCLVVLLFSYLAILQRRASSSANCSNESDRNSADLCMF